MEIGSRNQRLEFPVLILSKLVRIKEHGYVLIKFRIIHIPAEPAVFIGIKTGKH